MNPANVCHLEGIVCGPCWTRWKSAHRVQVRFWLVVESGQPTVADHKLLCAIEPAEVEAVRNLEETLTDGVSVRLEAEARQALELVTEQGPGVIFVAEFVEFTGGKAAAVAHAHRWHHQVAGKMAAAGDDSAAELPLGGAE